MKNYLKILMIIMATTQLHAAAVDILKYDDLKPKVVEAINTFKKKLEILGSDDVYKCFLWENLTLEKIETLRFSWGHPSELSEAEERALFIEKDSAHLNLWLTKLAMLHHAVVSDMAKEINEQLREALYSRFLNVHKLRVANEYLGRLRFLLK